MNEYVMYGAQVSLYSGKLRAYLKKKNIPFREQLSSARVYRKFIIPRTGVRFIPVLQTPEDQVLQDTTEIIEFLEQRFPEQAAVPDTPNQQLAALILELFGDECLLLPAMHYRWNFSENHAFLHRDMGKMLAPGLPGFIQKPFGKKIAAKLNGFLPPLGITDKTHAAIEDWYMALLAELGTHFEQYPYLLGNRPTIADYGFIGPLYAHLYRDPYPGRMMREQAPLVAAWVERMISDEPAKGDLVGHDEIPLTLLPILRRFAQTQLPIILDVAQMLHEWAQQNPGKALPRMIGTHRYRINDVEEQRSAIVYPLWMYQRCLDHYLGLSEKQKSNADTLLREIGAYEGFNTPLPQRVVRQNNRLALS